MGGEIGAPSRESVLAIPEWLESPYLGRVARRVAYRYGLRSQDATDLLQEVYLALWRAGPAARVNATWIFQTAIHKAVDIWRQRRRATMPIDGRTGTARQAELLHLLHARVDRLPRHLRQFYALRFQQGLSQRETAAYLGLSRGSVRSLDRKCLMRIRGQVRA